MTKPINHDEFDEMNRASAELLAGNLANANQLDSDELIQLEAVILERLLGAEIAALFEERS